MPGAALCIDCGKSAACQDRCIFGNARVKLWERLCRSAFGFVTYGATVVLALHVAELLGMKQMQWWREAGDFFATHEHVLGIQAIDRRHPDQQSVPHSFMVILPRYCSGRSWTAGASVTLPLPAASLSAGAS